MLHPSPVYPKPIAGVAPRALRQAQGASSIATATPVTVKAIPVVVSAIPSAVKATPVVPKAITSVYWK
jgi:hypothetical protein